MGLAASIKTIAPDRLPGISWPANVIGVPVGVARTWALSFAAGVPARPGRAAQCQVARMAHMGAHFQNASFHAYAPVEPMLMPGAIVARAGLTWPTSAICIDTCRCLMIRGHGGSPRHATVRDACSRCRIVYYNSLASRGCGGNQHPVRPFNVYALRTHLYCSSC